MAALLGSSIADEVHEAKLTDLQTWKQSTRFVAYVLAVLDKSVRMGKEPEGSGTRIALILFVNYLCQLLAHPERPLRERGNSCHFILFQIDRYCEAIDTTFIYFAL